MGRGARPGGVAAVYRRLDEPTEPVTAVPEPPAEPEPEAPALSLDRGPPPPDPGSSRDRREARVRRFMIDAARVAAEEPPAGSVGPGEPVPSAAPPS